MAQHWILLFRNNRQCLQSAITNETHVLNLEVILMQDKKGSWGLIAMAASLFCLGAGVFFGFTYDCLSDRGDVDACPQARLQSMDPANTHGIVVFQFSPRK